MGRLTNSDDLRSIFQSYYIVYDARVNSCQFIYAVVVLETAAPELKICVYNLRSSHATITWLIILPERQSTGGSTRLVVLILTNVISTTLFHFDTSLASQLLDRVIASSRYGTRLSSGRLSRVQYASIVVIRRIAKHCLAYTDQDSSSTRRSRTIRRGS